MNVLKRLFSDKRVKIFALGVALILLLILVYQVFFGQNSANFEQNSQESRLSALLEQLDGVTEASVMIATKEDEIVSLTVVFRGRDSLKLRTQILSVCRGALNVSQKCVQIQAAK